MIKAEKVIKTFTRGGNNNISMLGLGAMGAAIAQNFIGNGFHTTVWNRSADKYAPLVDAGATVAPTAAEAVAASPIIVICLIDNTAVDKVLLPLKDIIANKVIVNLTSGSPAQARAFAHWAEEHDASYIDGKILADPADVGTPKGLFFFSGQSGVFAANQQVLAVLGTITYLDEDPGAASVDFLSQITIGYEILIGFLHTLRLVQAEGVDIEAFAERVAGTMVGYPPLLISFAKSIKNGTYGPDLGSLHVQVALFNDLISHRESKGVETVRMREVKNLMDERIADGYGDQGFSSLFELLGKQ